MHRKIRAVTTLPDFRLSVPFAEGVAKIFDMKPWFDFYPPFKEFEKNPKHFDGVVIEAGGFGLSWDDELDMDCTAIWDEGEIAHPPFDGGIALSDAAKLWELKKAHRENPSAILSS